MVLKFGITAAALVLAGGAAAQTGAKHEAEARGLFEKAISFRTAQGQGQVPKMAAWLGERLRAGGVPAEDIVILPHEDTAAMIVRIPGRNAKAKPILFSGHMDVVDARPEDWKRDPFTLIEENGYFYGRGTGDNKAGVVALASTILRLKASGRTPARTLVFAFVGDEETTFGTTRLIAAHPWVKNAEFAINTDAGGGTLTEDGKPLMYSVQGAEKTYATFKLTARNPGGHSSRPRGDNAIYDLAEALVRIKGYEFPAMSNALTRSYFGVLGKVLPGDEGAVVLRFAANPEDPQAIAALRRNPGLVGTIATTCVATMLDAGHAENALPQRAEATVNCRIFPGVSVESVQAKLVEVVANKDIAVAVIGNPQASPVSEPRADVMGAIAKSVHARYPGLPITPYQESGGTDGVIYRSAGIPTYASSGLFYRESDIFFHGLDERVSVRSFYEGVEHGHDLAVTLGGVK
jgi:acetylornithine deacetylase/succinyl-diaminopimelate desuccinylase-like protein